VERKRALHHARSTASCGPVIRDTILISQLLKFRFLNYLAIVRYRSRDIPNVLHYEKLNAILIFPSRSRVISISIYRYINLDMYIALWYVVLRLKKPDPRSFLSKEKEIQEPCE